MTFLRAAVQQPAAGVAISDIPEGLKEILQPDCAASIWHRQMPAKVQGWLNALDPEHLPQGRVTVQPAAAHSIVTELCDIADTPQCSQREHFVEDVAALASVFADVMQAAYLRLRLQAVSTNACRKFHIDAITARMVCTYRGVGTQYGIGSQDDDPARVFTVPTGAPIVMRGTRWPETPASGVLHRSPPIEGTGQTRLILVLDAVDSDALAVTHATIDRSGKIMRWKHVRELTFWHEYH